MLFGLDNLNISPEGFRVLFHVIRRGYHDKTLTTSQGELMDNTGLSRYKVKAAITELTDNKLIHVNKKDFVYQITLMPIIVNMIALDYKRKGAKTRNMAEIKKSQGQPQKQQLSEPGKQQKSPTLFQLTSTRERLQIGSKDSLKNTAKNSEKKKVDKPKTRTTIEKAIAQLKAQPQPKKRGRPLGKGKRKASEQYKRKKLPFVSTQGKLYKYFQEWLFEYEGLRHADIVELIGNERIFKYWKMFCDYADSWLKLNRMIDRPDPDLNKIKFMKFAASQLAS